MLLDCLHSLISYVEIPYHVHILNNGDVEDHEGKTFQDFINDRYPKEIVSVYDMGENRGWEGAHNWAWSEVITAPAVMVLNDDVVFLPWHRPVVRNMVNYFQHEDVGAIGPVSNVVMGAQQFQTKGLPVVHETTILVGFCCIYKTEALQKISKTEMPWDENLPGGDDLDISIRLRDEGYKLLVDRTAFVYHHGFQTGQRIHGENWNSNNHRVSTDNALIKKHGVKKWLECSQSIASAYEPITVMSDEEGDWIRERVPKGKGLDVGVGANKTVENAIGVDRVAGGDMGQTGGRRGVPSVAEVEADCDDLPFEDESQDFLVARHVLEHLVDTSKTLTEWRRVLKPDGSLILACPNHDVTPTMILDSEHVHAFTPTTLANTLKMHQFHIEDEWASDKNFSFCIKASKNGHLN